MKKFILFISIVLLTSACCHDDLPTNTTPISQVIYAHKNALVSTAERSLFEEFVKYKKFGGTFALYAIKGSSIGVDTSISDTNSTQVNGKVSYPFGAEISTGINIEVKNDQAGKVNIDLVPIANDPEIYLKIKDIFDKTNSNNIYKLTFDKLVCENYSFCFELDHIGSCDNNACEFAYLSNLTGLRELQGKIRELPLDDDKKDKDKNCETANDKTKKACVSQIIKK